MGPIWGRQDPGGPHVGPTIFVIWVFSVVLCVVNFAHVVNMSGPFLSMCLHVCVLDVNNVLSHTKGKQVANAASTNVSLVVIMLHTVGPQLAQMCPWLS